MKTTSEVATDLGISLRSVQQYIKRELIKAEKHGRDWFISDEELERFKSERRKRGRPKQS